MLVPAIAHKDELLKKFSNEIYTEKYFYYIGYAHVSELPAIGTQDNCYQYAIIDTKREKDDQVIGYLAYTLDPVTDSVSRFGLYSFDQGNVIVGEDLHNKMEELYNNHHRIEWRVISGNPVIKHYNKFCNDHRGTKVTFHDVCKDLEGNYRDEYVYEIINWNK